MGETSDNDAPFPNNLHEMGGLHPDIAKGMGVGMPKMPPMGAGDQLKQTRYTIKQYHETVVLPLLAHSKKQDMAIKKLSQKIRETEARAGTYTLDMDYVKSNAPARIRETVGSMTDSIPANISSPQELAAYASKKNRNFDLANARSEISQMNNEMSN